MRGWEYDLRITFRPVEWLTVLNRFSLGEVTYLMFYGIIGIGVCFVVALVWAFFRLTTKQSNPPKLHFWLWVKTFEYAEIEIGIHI